MTNLRPKLEFFSSTEVERVIGEACTLLARGPGVLVEAPAAEELLRQAGASRQGDRLLLPEELIRSCVAQAPAQIQLFDRAGRPAAVLGAGETAFAPGSAAMYLFDATQGGRRHSIVDDVRDLARLVDHLPHYRLQATALVPHDVPTEAADAYRLFIALQHCSKPVVTGTFTTGALEPMAEMLALFRQDEQDLAQRPMALFDCCTSPPLRWSRLTSQTLVDCARRGLPVELISMPLAGATGPVTLRDSLVQHCAENLSGLVLAQVVRPGAPVVYGGAPAAFDMKRGSTPMGAIETMMLHGGYAQIGRHLGLPVHGYLALSDGKLPDYQAGLESGWGALMATMAGFDVASGPGLLDYLLTQSLEKLVLDHEACRQALRLAQGISSPGDSCLNLVTELVERGQLLGHGHTRRHWRRELSLPSVVIDRESYGDWEQQGGASAAERASAEVQRLLKQPAAAPLPPEVTKELRRIIVQYEHQC
jgi:trimethylamine--corrinoid protein Co-methyltransferase